MKSDRQRDNLQRPQTRASRARAWVRVGLLVLFASLLVGLALAVSPGMREATTGAGMAHGLSAQESPFPSPLSIAFNNDAASAKQTQSAVSEPETGGPSNLLRVSIVIAGVLLVTGIVFWRQR